MDEFDENKEDIDIPDDINLDGEDNNGDEIDGDEDGKDEIKEDGMCFFYCCCFCFCFCF